MPTVRVYNPATGTATNREVLNLGWLLSHAAECDHIRVAKSFLGPEDANMTAYGNLPDGRSWVYHSTWASYNLALEWIQRPSLAHLTHVYHDGRQQGHSEYVAVSEKRHKECYPEDV
jgi:hypothetical protein